MKKLLLPLLASILFLTLTFTTVANEAVQAKTMWGKIEFKKGMIGKVKITQNTNQYSISNNKLKKGPSIKKGKEYGVYSYSKNYGGVYKIGSNKYVKKSNSIKYYMASQKLINDVKTDKGDLSTSEIAKLNDDKVVLIEVNVRNGKSQGSGVIVGNGLILTNEHVVNGMRSGTITLNNGKKYKIKGVVVSDKTKDLALVKTNDKITGINPVKIGSYKSLAKGQKIVAIGSPLGLQNTVSEGIVSSFRVSNGVKLIQISAPIDHGSSGGGLFNKKGELVGITSSGYNSNADLNFAVAIDEMSSWNKYFKMKYTDIKVLPINNPTNSPILGDIALGMTKAQVKKLETATLYQEKSDSLSYKDKLIFEYTASVIYEFKDDKLVAINIYHDVVNNQDDLDLLEKYFLLMYDNIAAVYGEADGLDTNWYDDDDGYSISAFWDEDKEGILLTSTIMEDFSSFGGIRIALK
ncbi:S1C family serine protease [Rummeliibacillus sp. NPDC094406]|uniref:S1C family serine protease n=1 Tax=Rummeliibacillus sp. NPDC094406 TaxID=3364511 RepID=UPI0038092041